MVRKICLPGVPAISTLNVRSMVLFSYGDPLWSLEDKKKVQFFTPRVTVRAQKAFVIKEMEMSHTNASSWILIYIDFFRFVLFTEFFVAIFWPRITGEKLLTLTLETLGSKEVARWLVWLQNTKEHV